MKIKIDRTNPESVSAIRAALETVNGRSKAHAYTTFGEIESIAKNTEEFLYEFLTKADFSGAEYVVASGDPVANSYNNKRNGTEVTLRRGSSAWYLVEARQVELGTNGGGRGFLRMTRKQDQIARDRVSRNYVVIN